MEGNTTFLATGQWSKRPFEANDKFSDLVLLVEGHKLYVSKTLLMIHSPVFERMFTADFKEKELREITLPEKKYSTMAALLEQIYPGTGVDLINDETLPELLQLADEYDVQQVFHNCQQYIKKKIYQLNPEQTVDLILFYLGIVDRYARLHSLRQRLVHLAACIPATTMEQSKSFYSVPIAAIKDALMLRSKAIERFGGDFSKNIRKWIKSVDENLAQNKPASVNQRYTFTFGYQNPHETARNQTFGFTSWAQYGEATYAPR